MAKKSQKGQPVAAESSNLTQERLDHLRDLYPEAFSEGKVDFEKLRAALGDLADGPPERYSFTWAGKRDAIRLLQTPSRATLVPCPEESVNFETTRHVFVEGENLEVLKVLHRSYAGRVKLIYIDPPYNTGNDFIYRDDFVDPLENYLRLTQQKAENGDLLTSNPETNGRYHSFWLSMMYPRLFLARQLLTEDGIIFVSIDDNEIHNLRMMLNEVFGEENFLAQICWKNVYGGGAKSKHVVPQHEYVLLYARSANRLPEINLPPDPKARKRYTERDDKYEERGPFFTQPLATTSMDFRPNLRFPVHWRGEEIWPEKQWQWSKDRVEQALANDELVIRREGDKWSVRYKQYLRNEDGVERGSKLYSTFVGPWSQEGTAEIAGLFGDGKVFPFPKPSKLIKSLASAACQKSDAIILDFFAGSCPTAQAVLELNREQETNLRFIMVQIPEPVSADSAAGRAGFATIAEVGKERIRRVFARMENDARGNLDLRGGREAEDLGFRVFKLSASHRRVWVPPEPFDTAEWLKQMELFNDPLLPGWTTLGVIYETALREGYSLTCRIEELPKTERVSNTLYRVTDEDRGQSFRICLDDKLASDAYETLGLGRDDLFICRDAALDDTLAANLALYCRLKTI